MKKGLEGENNYGGTKPPKNPKEGGGGGKNRNKPVEKSPIGDPE